VATTGMTVLIAAFVGTVYLAGLLARQLHLTGPVAAYAAIGHHFEMLGYVIVAAFVLGWAAAAVTWRLGGFDRRYPKERA
jgi:nickel/cobalt transporter (NiCoT) family protein